MIWMLAVFSPWLQSLSEMDGNMAVSVGPGVGIGLSAVQPGTEACDTASGTFVDEGWPVVAGAWVGAGVCVALDWQAASTMTNNKLSMPLCATLPILNVVKEPNLPSIIKSLPCTEILGL